MIKVLFTGGGGAGSEALWRLLGDRYELHFGDADPLAIDPIIPADRRHKLPWASDPDFVLKMNKFCRRFRIGLLVPCVDEELLALVQNANLLAPTRLLLPNSFYVEAMLDKLHMITVLSKKGISVPLTQTLDKNLSDIVFPCISKPRKGRGSRDVRLLKSEKEAMGLKMALGDKAENILLQNKIEGVEYTVQMIANADRYLCAIVPVRVGIKRGITICAQTEAEPRVIQACRAIHEAVPAEGCYNIQLILTAEGNALPFEINPRISTTFCLAVAAGIDPIEVFFNDAKNDSMMTFETGLQLRRHWTNYFL